MKSDSHRLGRMLQIQVIIAVLVNEVFSPQEIPVIEQGVLAIDYFAIKED